MIQTKNNDQMGFRVDVLNSDTVVSIEHSSSFYNFHLDKIGYEESKKIKSFGSLEEGWHYGEGRAIGKEILQIALELDRKAYKCGYFLTDAFPGIDGEIVFTIYYKNDYFEFCIENNGLINFIHEYKDKEVYSESNISSVKALKKVENLRAKICILSDYSTNYIGIPIRRDLTESPLKTYVGVYQSFPKNVSYKVDEESASILESFTQALPVHPPYSGDSLYRTYLINVK